MDNNKKKSSFVRNICIGVFFLVILIIIYFVFGDSIKKFMDVSVGSISESTNNLTNVSTPIPAPTSVPTAVPSVPVSVTGSAPVAVSQIAGNKAIKSLFNINNLNTSISEFQKNLNK